MRTLKIHDRLKVVVGTLVYLALLTFVYVHVMSDVYAYMGFRMYNNPFLYIVTGYVLAALPALWVPMKMERPSQVAYLFLYLLVIVPTCIVPMFAINDIAHKEVLIIAFIVLCFWGLQFAYKLPLCRLPDARFTWRRFWLVVGVITSVLYAWVLMSFDLSFKFVSFYDVYDVRLQYRAESDDVGRLAGYSVIWLGNVIGPLFIADGFINKRPITFGLGIFIQLSIYSLTAFKSILLAGLLIAVLLFIVRRNGVKMGNSMVWGACALIVVALVLEKVTGIMMILYLAVGRTILLPGLLSIYYIEYFTNNPKALMAHSIFSYLVEHDKAADPSFLVGANYFGSHVRANANVWADAFANFGTGGIFVFTIFLGLVMWIYDSVSLDVDRRYAALLIGIPAITLANSALHTSMLTHGIALSMIIILLMPRE